MRNVILQATPFTERKGHAATIELSPQQKLAVTNEIRTLLRMHPFLTMCLVDVSISFI